MCGDSYAAIAADLKAGLTTAIEAEEAYAAAAVKCKAEGKKMAGICAGPFGPKPPTDALTTTPANECAAAIAEMKNICSDSAANIAAKLKAGEFTAPNPESQISSPKP